MTVFTCFGTTLAMKIKKKVYTGFTTETATPKKRLDTMTMCCIIYVSL